MLASPSLSPSAKRHPATTQRPVAPAVELAHSPSLHDGWDLPSTYLAPTNVLDGYPSSQLQPESERYMVNVELLRTSVELLNAVDSQGAYAHKLPVKELAALYKRLQRCISCGTSFTQAHVARAASVLTRCLPCHSRGVRRCTVHLLHLLVVTWGGRVLKPHTRRVIELLQHKEWGVRCTALQTLRIAPTEVDYACATKLVVQLSNSDWGLRHVALEALGVLSCEMLLSVASQLLSVLEGLDWEARRGVLRVLAELPPGSLSPLASTIYNLRALIGSDVDRLLRPTNMLTTEHYTTAC
ncbi:hypothetical protein AB1Y20_003801 [Prymnesium parvum]|uniref:Uncharacterized protein n=1 Tax=Prymnesium parvum TaxID=97485 RepID=A0AB34J5R0_PRYPA